MSLIFAFDIERSGATTAYDTIAIGACVMDSNFNELDRYFCNCYFTKETVFENRCYEQFWSKNLDMLKTFIYYGPNTKKQREKEMIVDFQEFRKKWETFADENKLNFYLVSDNNVYDGGFVNDLICKYTKDLPIPYTASKQEYESFFETHSMQKGLLLSHGLNVDWGMSDKIKSLYDVPEYKKFHDHNPANDAYTIAFDMLVLFKIASGEIKYKLEVS